MPELAPDAFLAACAVDAEIFALRPDYRALLLVVDDLSPVPRTAETLDAVQADATAAGATAAAADDELIAAAERHARELLTEAPAEDLPHVAAWREAYRAFGAKPQRTRNSLEALTRRAEGGLPRVNALTDIYNAISVLHQIPLGGEDFDRYRGPARLARATGDEAFDTFANGAETVEHPDAGEVVWCDGHGVTCRRWNWRQGRRTALTGTTASALFILDALAPVTDEQLHAAADALVDALSPLGGGLAARRLIGAS